jgi:hypothetical protein
VYGQVQRLVGDILRELPPQGPAPDSGAGPHTTGKPMAASSGAAGGVRVFLSYAHESPKHREAVRELWLLLRSCGVDAQWDGVAEGRLQDWALWTADQIRGRCASSAPPPTSDLKRCRFSCRQLARSR